MKTNELREGNLFYHDKNKINYGTHIVCEITKNGIVNEHSVLIPYNEVEPIPLTEEWLIKFGFEWIEELFAYADENHYVIFMSSGLIELHPFCTNDGDCHIKVKYVHTLQNLIFALTNEELKCKQDETH